MTYGFIVPIYKSGPKDDPTNYRGITIGSALGKLFAKILNTRFYRISHLSRSSLIYIKGHHALLYQKPFSSQ
jgi:hypothetical protein